MALNFPGPYELRFRYTSTSVSDPLDHTARYNVDLTTVPTVGDLFSTIDAKTRGGVATPDLATAIEAWLTLLQPRFTTTTTFGIWELWEITPLSFQSKFISSYNSTITAGTDVTGTTLGGQEIYTFRTLEGGIMRANLMETIASIGSTLPYPTGNTDINAIFDFVKGLTNWILARDTSYPTSALNFLPGNNEKIENIRFR